MTRTQIQLPDALYEQAKALARRHEISLAELVRRGLEHMLRIYPADEKSSPAWAMPESLDLGELRAPVERWREIAHGARAEPGEADR